MIKYRITNIGLAELYEYTAKSNNIITMEEKVLTILGGGVAYPTPSIHSNVIKDKAVKTRRCTEGTILVMLKDMEANGMVTSYDDSTIERTSGGGINGNN